MVQPVKFLLDLQCTNLATGFHLTADLTATHFTELSPGHPLPLNSCPKHWAGGPSHRLAVPCTLFCRTLIPACLLLCLPTPQLHDPKDKGQVCFASLTSLGSSTVFVTTQ